MGNLITSVKSLMKHSRSRLNLERGKLRALRVLKHIESLNGKTEKAIVQKCDDYAGDVLGWRGYSPWLYVYSNVAAEFKDGWDPKQLLRQRCERAN